MDLNSRTNNQFMHNSQQVNVFIHNYNLNETQPTADKSTAIQEHAAAIELKDKVKEWTYYHPSQQQQQQERKQVQKFGKAALITRKQEVEDGICYHPLQQQQQAPNKEIQYFGREVFFANEQKVEDEVCYHALQPPQQQGPKHNEVKEMICYHPPQQQETKQLQSKRICYTKNDDEQETYYHPLQRPQHQQQQQQPASERVRRFSKWRNFTKRLKQIFKRVRSINKCEKENVSLVASKRDVQAFCLKIQEAFDKQIDQVLPDVIEKHFASSLNEFHSKFASNLTSNDLFNLMAICLLENTMTRFKKQISNFPTNHVRYVGNRARHEIMYNGINGRYRRLFDGFDVTIPPLDDTSDVESNLLRRKIFWDISRITHKSKFVLDAEANRLFKGKCKCHKQRNRQYRQLMRYVADSQDIKCFKAQLTLNQQREENEDKRQTIKVNFDKRRIVLLLWDQLVDLQKQHNCYADCDMSGMYSFTVPEFIIRKIRLTCVRIQIRSNGIVTTLPIAKKQLDIENCKKCNNDKEKQSKHSVKIQSGLRRNTNQMNKLPSIAESSNGNSSHLIFGAFLNNPISASGRYRTKIVYTPRNRGTLI